MDFYMYYIGIDLGGTNIAVGIVTQEGKLVQKTSVPTRAQRPFEEIFADMANCIHKLCAETGIPLSETIQNEERIQAAESLA